MEPWTPSSPCDKFLTCPSRYNICNLCLVLTSNNACSSVVKHPLPLPPVHPEASLKSDSFCMGFQ